jgi:hypothetical protein
MNAGYQSFFSPRGKMFKYFSAVEFDLVIVSLSAFEREFGTISWRIQRESMRFDQSRAMMAA